MRNTLVLALGAWISMCCCDRRAIAELFLATDAATLAIETTNETLPPCCAKAHCGQDASQQRDTNDPAQHSPGHCNGACCVKLNIAHPQPDLTPDSIGAALDAASLLNGTIVTLARDMRQDPLVEFNRSDGEPPPRHRLVITARFLI